METTRNALTDEQRRFFDITRELMGTPFYYFGSIQRLDYIAGRSDIDVDVFSHHPERTARRLLHILNGPNASIHRVVWRFDGHEILGFKVKYKRHVDIANGIAEPLKVEFSVYDENMKHLVLQKHRQQMFVSPYISGVLLLIKAMFKGHWIYYAIKKRLLSRHDEFLTLPY